MRFQSPNIIKIHMLNELKQNLCAIFSLLFRMECCFDCLIKRILLLFVNIACVRNFMLNSKHTVCARCKQRQNKRHSPRKNGIGKMGAFTKH